MTILNWGEHSSRSGVGGSAAAGDSTREAVLRFALTAGADYAQGDRIVQYQLSDDTEEWAVVTDGTYTPIATPDQATIDTSLPMAESDGITTAAQVRTLSSVIRVPLSASQNFRLTITPQVSAVDDIQIQLKGKFGSGDLIEPADLAPLSSPSDRELVKRVSKSYADPMFPVPVGETLTVYVDPMGYDDAELFVTNAAGGQQQISWGS